MEEHVATCEECYAIWQGDLDFLATEQGAPANVVPMRKAAMVIGSLAAAAAVAAVFLITPIRERIPGFEPTGMRALIKRSANLENRPLEPRLSADFSYRPWKSPTRGGEDQKIAEKFMALTAKEVAADPKSDAREKATAHLLLKQPDDAIRILEEELKKEGPDPKLLNDLAVAYLQGRRYADALGAIDQAWKIEPSPRLQFNRALALQGMEKYAEARAAWDEYLKLDPDSEWREDAIRNRRYLTE